MTWAARAYLLGLVGHSLLEVASRAFYARQDARTPLLASMISLTTFVVTSLMLYRNMGAMGIALSNSLAFSLEAGLLIYFLSRRFPAVIRQGRPLLRLAAGCVLAGGAAFAVMSGLPLPDLVAAALALALGALVTAAFIHPELRELAKL